MEVNQKGATRLYRVLREYLRRDPDGERLISAFEADPTGGSNALAARLDTLLHDDPQLADQLLAALGEDADARFVNMITGGQVDQIVNVARLGVLNLTVKRYLYVFKDVAQLVVFLLAVAVVGVAIGYAVWRAQQPQVMTGDFNIAVADFGEVDSNGRLRITSDSSKISRALANYLDSEYTSGDFGLQVQVSHDRMPLVEEDRQARQLADKVNADLVIYGTMLGDGHKARLLPRFWVDPSPDLTEISGQNSLEAPISYEPARLADTGYLTETLRNNAAILVLFTRALVSYNANNMDAAALSLDLALKEAQGDFPGKEVLYLLGSTIARLQHKYELALQRADKTLALNPEYARGYLAGGNVYYDVVTIEGNWQREDLLDEAQQWYLQALEAKDAAAGAYIDEKTSVALGNILVIKAQLRNDPLLYQQGMNYLNRVVNRYEASRDESYRADIQQVVALAYHGLGAAWQRQGDREQAGRNYQLCKETTTDARTLKQCTQLFEEVSSAP